MSNFNESHFKNETIIKSAEERQKTIKKNMRQTQKISKNFRDKKGGSNNIWCAYFKTK